jgi:hypothetical protein
MRLTRVVALVWLCVMTVACGGNDVHVRAVPVSTSTSTSTNAARGPLQPPADPSALLRPDTGTALSSLGFPAGWPLPPSGAAEPVGVLVRHSKGDVVHHTYRTVYVVASAPTEDLASQWAATFGSHLKSAPLSRTGIVTTNGLQKVLWSSSADATPDAAKLSVSAGQLEQGASASVAVVAEYETADDSMPSIVLAGDSSHPSFDGCEISRIDLDYHRYADPAAATRTPTYDLRTEATCPQRTAFDTAVTWAKAHGASVSADTTRFSETVDLGDGRTVDVDADVSKNGPVFLMAIVHAPITSITK